MATVYNRRPLPPVPAGAPPWMQQWAREVERVWRESEQEVERAFNAAEKNASLQVLSVAPDRSQDGDEVEVSAALGAVAPFGSGAGKYVMRAGVWVHIG